MVQKGKVVFEIGPEGKNARNCAPDVFELKDGRLMLVYGYYLNSKNDWGNSYVAARYSKDRGITWTEPKIIFGPEKFNAVGVSTPSVLRMANGDIGLFFTMRKGFHDLRIHLSRSSDEAETWSEPICCIPGPGYYVTNSDRVIRLSSGRIIIPASYHPLRGNDKNNPKNLDKRSIVYFFYSDDDGNTWNESANYCSISVPFAQRGLQEPGVIELENNVLWAFARTDIGRQYEMFSYDMGENWTLSRPSAFTSPWSPLGMKRIPNSDYLLAVWNPIPIYNMREYKEISWGRDLYIGAVSNDEGKTWQKHFIIEEDENRGFCYSAIEFVDNNVILVYNAGGQEDGNCLSRLRIRLIPIDEIII